MAGNIAGPHRFRRGLTYDDGAWRQPGLLPGTAEQTPSQEDSVQGIPESSVVGNSIRTVADARRANIGTAISGLFSSYNDPEQA